MTAPAGAAPRETSDYAIVHKPEDARPNPALSARERDVLLLVAEGRRDQEIGVLLFLSHHTVANHVRNILAKFGVSSRAAAVAYAARRGLL